MAIEEGIVIDLKPGPPAVAVVKTVRSSACESCSARHSCNVDRNSNEMEVQALNLAGAGIGDRVCIEVATKSLLKISFLTYIFPMICMLLGGLAGNQWALATGQKGSAIAVMGAAAAFGTSFLFLRIVNSKMENNDSYRPQISRIIRKAPIIKTPQSAVGSQPQKKGRYQ